MQVYHTLGYFYEQVHIATKLDLISLYNKNKIMHKHELIFSKQQTVSTTEKTDCKQIMNSLGSMNAS